MINKVINTFSSKIMKYLDNPNERVVPTLFRIIFLGVYYLPYLILEHI